MAKFADRMEKIAGGVAEGYQKMEDYIYFEEGSRELTITLVPEEAAA